MENKYYTPTLDQFVQGFEFEYLDIHSYRMVIMDFSSNEPCDFTKFPQTTFEEWHPVIVNWMYAPGDSVLVDYGDYTIEHMGSSYNWMSSWYHRNIPKLIEDGRIRCKK